MRSRYARLDRFLSQRLGQSRREIQRLLASGRVRIDDAVTRDGQQQVGPFSRVQLDAELLQADQARYLMLNKPAGVVSATRDTRHRTALDLLDEATGDDLHIAGRLDFHSTGLLLLTNDGNWSRQLSTPGNRVSKRYRVTLEKPLSEDYVRAFAEGMWFEHEGITTRPAGLVILSDHVAEVTLTEGRYHQIKRMFGRFRNRVLTLHRFAVGDLLLDPGLETGTSRALTKAEVLAANPLYRPG
ncbi:MAG: 16S rRNA pseudouridine(516) synthase [Alcanivoracaceae bacterium]|nr:16S rRNA pseudouridine(516) synthase [Alcanivoracaceae bacterium]